MEIGDRIEIGDYAGDVIDIRFFQYPAHLLSAGGRTAVAVVGATSFPF